MIQVFLVFGVLTAMNIGIGNLMIDHQDSADGVVEISSLAVVSHPLESNEALD
ncbi:MAG: hypothetical protein MI976_20285 [Pseudomonadales bacterium]|nr:hypothetical protein [Pseudomonadales bacterium]